MVHRVCLYQLIHTWCDKIPSMSKYYGAVGGRVSGVFDNWKDCQENVPGYSNAKYRKFSTREEALRFVENEKKTIKRKAEDSTFEESNSHIAKRVTPAFGNVSSNIMNIVKPSPQNALEERIHTLEEKILRLEERMDAVEAVKAFCGIQETTYDDDVILVDDVTLASSSTAEFSSNASTSNVRKKLLQSAHVPIAVGSNRSYSTSATSKSVKSSVVVGTDKSEPWRSMPFRTDSDDFVQVFTDGACSKNGKMTAKAGVGVWFNDGHPLNVSEPARGRATNNVAEIEAATRAVERAGIAGVKKLCIITDSMFLLKCMTDWIMKWKTNNWKTSDGNPVKNKDQLIEFEQACKKYDMQIKWTHVPAHRGIDGNEKADALAGEGAKRYRATNIPSAI